MMRSSKSSNNKAARLFNETGICVFDVDEKKLNDGGQRYYDKQAFS